MQSLCLVVMFPVEYSLSKEEEEMDNEEQSTTFTVPCMETTPITKFTLLEIPATSGC